MAGLDGGRDEAVVGDCAVAAVTVSARWHLFRYANTRHAVPLAASVAVEAI
jgi:hypothetical protein